MHTGGTAKLDAVRGPFEGAKESAGSYPREREEVVDRRLTTTAA
jgi:hypothetical protein